MPKSSRCPAPSVPTATPLPPQQGARRRRRHRNRIPLESFPRPRNCGGATSVSAALQKRKHLVTSPITMTLPARSRATTRWRPSTARVEAVAQGEKRVLLVMATGTGKTYTTFQIIWRLWKAGEGQAHPVPGGPQHPGRPDTGQRLQALRLGHDQDQEPQDRPGLRNLSWPVPGITGPDEEDKIFKSVARFLRHDRHRRMPSRQRQRRFRLARNPRILRRRHPARADRHAQGNQVRLQHHLLRRAGLHLQRSSRASRTAFSRPTRWCGSTSTRTSTAGRRHPA
jgi:hypothetical protein